MVSKSSEESTSARPNGQKLDFEETEHFPGQRSRRAHISLIN